MTARVVHVSDKVPDAVYIGRAMPRQKLRAHPLCNPYRVQDFGRAEAISQFIAALNHWLRNGHYTEDLIALRGKPLACWCRHDTEDRVDDGSNWCHGDVLLVALNRFTDDELRALAVNP